MSPVGASLLAIWRYLQIKSIASKLAPTQFAARQRGVWTTGISYKSAADL